MVYVIDSSALFAYLKGEPGGDAVRLLLRNSDNTCFAHVVNLCEVFYNVRRVGGATAAQDALARLKAGGITDRNDLDTDFWQDAGRLKSVHTQASLGDCFCATLAGRLGVEAVTCDRPDFEPFAKAGVCAVRFVR